MAQLNQLMARRDYALHTIQKLDSLMSEALTNPLLCNQVRAQFTFLPKRIDDFETSHMALIAEATSTETRNELFSIYDEFIDTVGKLQIQFKQPPFSESLADSTAMNTAFLSNDSSQSQVYARLPKLDLPPFSGNIADWNSFFDLFKSSVHDNGSLKPVQKFQYLKSLLRKEALILIKNLTLTDDHYFTALKILQNRYEQKRLISSYHLQYLLDLPKLTTLTYQSATKFVASINEHIEALRANGEPVDDWSSILAFIVCSKFDPQTRTNFEQLLAKDFLPTLTEVISFINQFVQAHQWQNISHSHASNSESFGSVLNKSRKTHHASSYLSTASKSKCLVCSQFHPLYKCSKFHEMTVDKRSSFVRDSNYCFNCLSPHHATNRCQSNTNCRVCNKRHHTLLHSTKELVRSVNSSQPMTLQCTSDKNCSTTALSNLSSSSAIILGTAIVQIEDANGHWQSVRVLLDSGSESSYISQTCARRLHLTIHPADIIVSGFGNLTSYNNVKGITTFSMRSSYEPSYTYSISAITVQQIVQALPKRNLPHQLLKEVQHLQLADPTFLAPSSIDVLIGADLYFELLTGNINSLKHGPFAIETTLGWVVSGPIYALRSSQVTTLTTISIAASLAKFWELENVPSHKTLSSEDRLAERTFVERHKRLPSGRYVVPLLFKQFPISLGNSFINALNCYNSLQKRLSVNADLCIRYHDFMADYLDQNHMSPLTFTNHTTNEGFYLPHHGVLRVTNSSTKLRVVFNGSKRTNLHKSLNDFLLTGPALQADLTSVIHRSRLHKIIFTADIRQMYRQILIHEEHRSYQKILWCFSSSSTPQSYTLNTVTYGTTCAPFLAIRTLHQLADDERIHFPRAAHILKTDTYVDDIISGATSLDEALELKQELVALLNTAGLELRKWASNHPDLLRDISPDHQEFSFLNATNNDSSVNILGLSWNPISDTFSYKIHLPSHNATKRTILSDIAKIFDPMGWLSPVIMTAKCLMQELWLTGLHWDDPLPNNILSKWNLFKIQLNHLSALSIPRHIDTSHGHINLIGFCDASELGYAAVVYLHIESLYNNDHKAHLVASKTKVAPLKRISLPRLELCAALLLSQLMHYTMKVLDISFSHVSAWSDSTIALAWIKAPAYKWKTFVSNRVSEIQTNLPPSQWHHIASKDNPADCASRGLSVQDLCQHSLWWSGPPWFKHSRSSWALSTSDEFHVLDDAALTEATISFPTTVTISNDTLLRFSSLTHLLRITAYCVRFYNRTKTQTQPSCLSITAAELNSALYRWIRIIQHDAFSDTIHRISQNQPCSKSIQNLAPFLDTEGYLRVGGRLRHAHIPFSQKHPLLLPSKHHFTNLIIHHYHLKYLHPSPRTLHAIISKEYWILDVRRLIRRHTIKCMRCFRCRPTAPLPFMGNLPAHRVQQLKPFEVVGVDYGGPFRVTPFKRRGIKPIKVYLCLFICFTTKAVHLELSSDLSTDAFLMAFRRFIARRGKCSHIYSDSATNFVGAKSHFTELQALTTSNDFNAKFAHQLASDDIQWHFIPPSAPHFGGLWEAGIKSVKHHISRVVGLQILTTEEFYTFLCQIESILNSRPLCPLSSDPNDLLVLTPNHFLVQEAAVCLPDSDYLQQPLHLLRRWQLIQRMLQDFWKRWHLEYLNTLQQRAKWTTKKINATPGQLVLIKSDATIPLLWKLGRIVDVFPGDDGIVRVAQVKTVDGLYTRPIVKLCPVPHPDIQNP